MKELIDKLSKCYMNNGNARHIDYDSAEKILKQFMVCSDFVQSIANEIEYIDGRQYKYKYRDKALPVIEYNELVELAAKYDRK